MNNQPTGNSKYTKVMIYGALFGYMVLTTAWPWLWPDAYYHGSVIYIYLLTLINIDLVVNRNRPYDKWLLRGVCMAGGIALIEIIDEANKTVRVIDSDPEKFKFWEYYAAGIVVCVCLIGVTRFKVAYVCLRKAINKITEHVKRNTLLTWNKIATDLKVWSLRRRKDN